MWSHTYRLFKITPSTFIDFLDFFPVLVMYNFFSPKNPTLHVYSNLHIYQRDESNSWINTNHHISKILLIWIKVSSLFSFSFRKRPVQKRYESSKTVAEGVYDNNGCKIFSLRMKNLFVFGLQVIRFKRKRNVYFLISSQIFIQWGNWILFLNQNAFMFKETKFAVESLNFMIS